MNKQFLLVFICFLLSACGIKKHTNNSNALKPTSAKLLIATIEESNKSPDWLSLKGKINLNKDGQTLKLSTDIRIKKDSIIWMSIKAPLGIELFRAQLSTDSIFFLNIPKSTYTKASITYLQEHLKTAISYTQIQQIFFGTIEIPRARYGFSENENNYTLLTKKKNISFLIEKQDFRIIETIFRKSENEYFKLDISDYSKSENDFLIPKNLKIEVKALESFSSELNFTRITCNKKQKIHFSIPKNYVESQ